jgi:hypothetical protein
MRMALLVAATSKYSAKVILYYATRSALFVCFNTEYTTPNSQPIYPTINHPFRKGLSIPSDDNILYSLLTNAEHDGVQARH